MEGARYLWRRLPMNYKSNQPEISALWSIGKVFRNTEMTYDSMYLYIYRLMYIYVYVLLKFVLYIY